MPSLPCGPFVGDDSGENSSEASVPEKASLRVPDVEGSVFVSPSETSSGAQSSSGGDAETPEVMDSRAYQLEMLKKSLEGNVIVAVC